MEITKKTTAGHIQDQFRNEYPFLKLAFADKRHENGERILNGHYYDASFPLSKISGKKAEGVIEIHPWQQTGAVEELFRSIFGLNIQIFRLQDDRWIETAASDFLSLDEQNEIGRHLSLKEGNVCGTPETVLRSVY